VLPKSRGSQGAGGRYNAVHVSHHSVVFVQGTGATNWWSTDAGNTFYEDRCPVHLDGMHFHRRESSYAMGFVGLDMPKAVYVTRDAGRTWTKVFHSVLEADFGDSGHMWIGKNRVYGVAHEDWTDFDLVYTENQGNSYEIMQTNIFTARFLEHQIFTLAYADNWGDIYLRVSPDVGLEVKQFYRAEFPWGEDTNEKNLYNILDDHTGAVFMGINHHKADSRFGHLYVSDPKGIQYVLSLPHIVHAYTNFDFMRVLGLSGVYVANSLENYLDDPRRDAEIKSYISFNNGNTWEYITAPKLDMYGKPWPCTGAQCSLHLHGWRSYTDHQLFGPFYSANSALGLIIGNGNVGEYLLLEPPSTSTFISTDGGISFSELFRGTSIYEIGDHGGIVVWAELGKVVTIIHYTLDFGKTSNYITLDKPIRVWNIVSEDYLNGTSFLVIDFTYKTVVHLEFKDAFNNKVCDLRVDYEDWSPVNPYTKDSEGLKCLMGKEVVYSRRKVGSMCHSPPDYQDHKIKSQKHCKCTYEDFECDYGYYYTRRETSGKIICERDETIVLSDPPLWCKPGRKYNSTNGYRLEAGNDCRDGIDMHPTEKACPGTALEDADTTSGPSEGSSHTAGWVAIGVLVPIILLIVVAAFVALNSEKLRDRIPFLASLSNLRDGYARMGQPGGAPGALFDDEEYIIGSLDDRQEGHEEEDADGLKNVDLNSAHNSAVADDEFDPRK